MPSKKPFYAFKSKGVYSYSLNNTNQPQKGIYEINKNTPINYNYFKGNILINDAFNLDSTSGLYTWIIKRSGNFYTARIREGQEIGTLHNNLAYLTFDNDSTDVKYAGEIEKVGQFITFNFASGSYMAKTTITPAIINSFIEKLDSIGYPGQNITYSGSINTFIKLENDRLKPNKNRVNKLKTMYKWSSNTSGGKRKYTKKYRVNHRKTHKKY